MFRRLAAALYLRRLSRDLSRLVSAVESQTVFLGRLADRYAPIDPPTERATVHAETGVSYLDPVDAELAQAYTARTYQDTGHMPDDDEILIYLADEKTTDLHKRMIERAEQLARLAESRS